MQRWYRDAVDRPPNPARVAISTMTEERVELYWHVPFLGYPIPVVVQPFTVEDSITEEEDIAWVVHKLRLNHSGSPLGMRAEHLRQWRIGTTWDDTRDSTNWQKVVSILQTVLRDGAMAEEITWEIIFLIPKRKSSNFRGIRLVEVLLKTMTILLNRWLTAEIKFHYVLYGFRASHGTGTAALNAKLLQHLTAMREAVLFKVFLDIQKA